jgi:hypothetical protein
MVSTHAFLMTKTQILRSERMNHPLACRRCGRPLRIGDKVLSVGHGFCGRKTRGNVKRYHEACYESMFIDL